MLMRYFALLALLLLSACATPDYSAAPAPNAPPVYDPIYEREMANYRLQQAQAAILSTQEAETRQGEMTRFRQTEISSEVQGTQSALLAQGTSVALEQTQIAPTQQYEQRQATAQAQVVAAAYTATPAMATAQALGAAVEAGRMRVEQDRLRRQVWTWSAGIAIILIGAAGFEAIRKYADWQIQREQIVVGLRAAEDFVFNYDEWKWEKANKPSALPSIRSAPPRLEQHGSYNISPPDKKGESQLVGEFLRAALAVAGPGARQIPRWDKLGVTSDQAQAAIHALRVAQAVEVRPSQGTYVRDGTLGDLAYRFDTGRLSLTPLPHRGPPPNP
jgi:hypothetical protein